ncbi:hypothetical protein RE474_13220 [Methanolobus sediminis]|uniref:DUF4013 domain-containing protein n=1 Tax=Methanolobus sediminis TaxID=3072978 RepID=A0AA51UL00_9EURY|nr:hypothetical protein [Methanolobus sediminis]WMW25023.1 hypothetical protein RE474_13220 [Methanolobus sediminis]
MSWYVIDVIDKAIERTKACLFEPFDIMKWLKLAIIVFFIGGSGGFNSGGNGRYNTSGGEPDLSWIPDSFTDSMSNLSHHLSSYSDTTLFLVIALLLMLLFLLAIILGYIGSTMEFVLVDSLVSNDVRVREYFKKYMGKGLALYILRLILLLMFILILVLVSLPFIFMISAGDSGSSGALGIVGMIFVIIIAVLVLAIILGIIGSFVNMAIPVSMYQGSGFFSAIGNVFRQFRADWKQIVIYWIGRGVLGIAVAIIAGILGLIILVILLLILGAIDLGLYFILNMLLPGTILWSLLISVVVVELLLLSFASAMIRMPFSVFMKYHMLGFLELWYPLKMPMFDEHYRVPGSGSDQWIEEAMIPDE